MINELDIMITLQENKKLLEQAELYRQMQQSKQKQAIRAPRRQFNAVSMLRTVMATILNIFT